MSRLGWIIQMALRDFRSGKKRLALFASSMVLGIAALVAIISFGENLNKDIDRQAKELLGADLLVSGKEFDADSIKNLSEDYAYEVSFASMVAFPQNEESRLSQVRALQGKYPFYGNLETFPQDAYRKFLITPQSILVEKVLMAQLGASLGDSLKVGNTKFAIIGVLEKVPGQSGIVSSVAPAVYIPHSDLESTGLVQYGSRLTFNHYFKQANESLIAEIIDKEKSLWEQNNTNYETPESRKRSTGRAFGNLANFLSLVAFIALLLGSVGVGSAVNVFVKEKIQSVAILRCLGIRSSTAIAIFLMEILGMAFFASLLGALLGTSVQYILPQVFADFLPLEVAFSFSSRAIIIGLLTGMTIAILFSLLPLLRVRQASPMMTLRPSMEPQKLSRDIWTYLVLFGIGLFILGFSYLLLSSFKLALGFTGFILLAFGILWLLGKILMRLLRKFTPITLPYTLRQSLANLHRPNNQTISLISTIGLGTAMISTLFFLQNNLLEEVKIADRDNQPNMLLFDIQSAQLREVEGRLEKLEVKVLQQVPIVTMRLSKINGKDKSANEELAEDERLSRSLYNREFRVTYRDTLTKSEKLVEGQLRPVTSSSDTIFVSMDRDYSRRVGIKMGDQLELNVQGRPLITYVGSFRDVNYNQVSTNFIMLFPENVLEKAPKFHVIVGKTRDELHSADVQKTIVGAFPNVSMINLATILETLEEILSKISFVIQFMALFSILTGLIVLIGSLIISKYQRQRESILLRTLGATSLRVNGINILEYTFLGMLAAGSGLFLALLATGLLSSQVFEMGFKLPWLEALYFFVGISAIIVILGISNTRSIMKASPADILRE